MINTETIETIRIFLHIFRLSCVRAEAAKAFHGPKIRSLP